MDFEFYKSNNVNQYHNVPWWIRKKWLFIIMSFRPRSHCSESRVIEIKFFFWKIFSLPSLVFFDWYNTSFMECWSGWSIRITITTVNSNDLGRLRVMNHLLKWSRLHFWVIFGDSHHIFLDHDPLHKWSGCWPETTLSDTNFRSNKLNVCWFFK